MQLNFEHLRDGAAIVPEEGELLYALVRAIKPKVCVETGTHKGLSTHYIAQALHDNGEGHLYTCDPFDYEQETTHQQSSLKDWFTYYRMRGVDLVPPTPIDFFFCDGFHEKEHVLGEIEHFFPALSKNALVVFHDCDDIPESWEKMVNGAIQEKGLKTVYIHSKNRMRIYEHSGI